MSMSNACPPSFEHGLNALAAILNKAEARAKARKFDAGVLLNTRLFPDMWDLVVTQLMACIAKTLAFPIHVE